MIRLTPAPLIIAACMFAAPAWAVDDKLVILSAKGDFPAQLHETLCISEQCLPESKALAGGHVDFGKVARESIDAVIGGRLEKEKSGYVVKLTVRNREGAVRLEHEMPADSNGHVSITDLVAATSKILATVEHASFQKSQPSKSKVSKHHKAKASRLALRPGARSRKG